VLHSLPHPTCPSARAQLERPSNDQIVLWESRARRTRRLYGRGSFPSPRSCLDPSTWAGCHVDRPARARQAKCSKSSNCSSSGGETRCASVQVTGAGRIRTMHPPRHFSEPAPPRQNWPLLKPQTQPPAGAQRLSIGRLHFLPRPARPMFPKLRPAPTRQAIEA